MTRKRKRLKKLIMALGIPRDNAETIIDLGLIMDLPYAVQMAEVKAKIAERTGGARPAPDTRRRAGRRE